MAGGARVRPRAGATVRWGLPRYVQGIPPQPEGRQLQSRQRDGEALANPRLVLPSIVKRAGRLMAGDPRIHQRIGTRIRRSVVSDPRTKALRALGCFASSG